MTLNLYPWTTKEQLDLLKEYLIQSTPTTMQLVGLFICDGFHKMDPINNTKIFCSHSDPFNTNDIVVWIFYTERNTRVLVSTEIQLDKISLNPEAQIVAYSEDKYTETLPRYFSDNKHEELYQDSCKKLKQTLQYYDTYRHAQNDFEDVYYHGINPLWAPVFHEIYKVGFQSPCFKYIKPASAHSPSPIQLKSGLKLTSASKEDVDVIKASTSIGYTLEYLQQCAFISAALKTNDADEQLIGWVLTHRDMLVGALQILPAWRRQGLADILMQDICTKYVEFFKQNLPETPLDRLYFVSTVQTFNDASARLFEKLGWKRYGSGVTWLLCSKK